MKVTYFWTAGTIITGRGSLGRIAGEVKNLGATKILLVTDPVLLKTGLVDKVKEALAPTGLEIGLFSEVEPEPRLQVVTKCQEAIKEGGYDLLVAVGGGSSMDVAKAASILMTNPGTIKDYLGVNLVPNPGIPVIAVPTTAGTGSEVTPIAILSDVDEQLKKGVVSPYLLPKVAIVDPELTVTMPPHITAATGMDALTHAVEAYISVNATTITDTLALEAIRLIARHLRTAVANGEHMEARENMAMASLLAGIAFANAGVAAVHALAYPLGAQFHIPHGVANAVLLPYVMESNLLGALPRFKIMALAMGEKVEELPDREAADKFIEAIKQLSTDIRIPLHLRDLGVTAEAIPDMAEGAIKVTRLLANNPRKLTVDDIREIYERAF
ncbi:iron-containing alcohol dehydrogenase [Desulfofundulus thermosubterraneus]|uniref:Alcohol dehydrogenase, class IV n=1 Tax=Desulfofundulus thermosubterraneus DSM 16057 TaxID=1121432 RepID=A0A1M6G6R9_9FIRM|nr:iron-containing alcohol dehydrogenase [Desulfofundulus thermosubterraneus]SHJ05642.1 Alcohol dehydrogenase, class IV [Desulfofundulus thermosubterraneus DSM 16057]